MAKLTIQEVEVRYGNFVAVEQVSLTVDDGEFCVFLGPSGCGKTSTLRAIAGLIKPSKGQIIIDNEIINELYPGERDIGMVFQSYALYGHMTVAQHFAFPLKAQKLPKETIAQETQRIAELLNLADVLNRRPRELSIGQAQRVAIGRAIIRKPRLLLLDEPLNNLDMQLSLRTRAVLKRLQRDLGITTIYVTHDQEEAQSLADKIVVMHNGHIQQVGSPTQVYDEPVNEFVAGFIGTPPMNFMRCQVAYQAGETVLVGPGEFQLHVEETLMDRLDMLPNNASVTLGIRPERIRLEASGNDDLPHGYIHIVEPEGNEAVVSVRLANDILWKSRLTKALAGQLQRDMLVHLRLDQSKLHLFHPDSGERLVAEKHQAQSI
jgi:multiple sugar transport system ATP-binding protein